MNDKMSQDDIDKLLKQGSDSSPPAETEKKEPAAKKEQVKKSDESSNAEFTEEEKDTLGEISNIFMGSASTALSMLLSNKVEITTPRVFVYEKIDEVLTPDEEKVTVEINYIEGLEGTIVLALKGQDTAVIADLMMGGTGLVEKTDIGELQLSAVGEAMNQMVGTASTSLSAMLNSTVNISHPSVKYKKKEDELVVCQEIMIKPIVAVRFNLKIGELIDSEIIQVLSIDSARSQVAQVTAMMGAVSSEIDPGDSKSVVDSLINESTDQPPPPVQTQTPPIHTPGGAPPQQPQMQPQYTSAQNWAPPPDQGSQQQVTVQPVQFASFDNAGNPYGEANQNLNLVMDVKLGLTVELGRTELPIKNVLELTRGSIIELEKAAGEPVELYANGKLIAKGEVVVIEDNFGLRITSIISPEHRIKEL